MVAIASIVRRVISPTGTVPAILLRDKTTCILTTVRRTLVRVDVVEVAEESYDATADGVKVVARRRGIVVVALPVKVGIGGVGVLDANYQL